MVPSANAICTRVIENDAMYHVVECTKNVPVGSLSIVCDITKSPCLWSMNFVLTIVISNAKGTTANQL
jgi:hypothetical protein